MTALVILGGGVVLVCSGQVLAQEAGPGGAAPGADPPIDAGIDRSKLVPFERAQADVEKAEQEVEDQARRVAEAEATVKLAEQGLSVMSLDTARSELDKAKEGLDNDRKRLQEARDKREKELQKLGPDGRVDLAIVNLADRLHFGGGLLDLFLARQTVYRTGEEATSAGEPFAVPLTEIEHVVACWLAIAHLGPALRDGGASRDALERWEEARAKAWKIMTARVDQIVKKLGQTDLFQKGYHFMHAVYHRALAKGDHEQQRAGLAGGTALIIRFTGPCPGADCPEEKRQRGQTR